MLVDDEVFFTSVSKYRPVQHNKQTEDQRNADMTAMSIHTGYQPDLLGFWSRCDARFDCQELGRVGTFDCDHVGHTHSEDTTAAETSIKLTSLQSTCH